MDRGLLAPGACVKRVFIVVYLLLGSTRHSGTDSSCSCSSIPPLTLTMPPEQNCSINNNAYRYKCIDGYVRMAGTSNLIRCTAGKWSNSTLICIENPLNPPKKTSTIVTPTVYVISSVSPETDLETTSTVLPPLHTSEASSQTTTLPQSSTNSSCSCSSIPPLTLTMPPEQNCSINNNAYRYKCIDGYVRMAGTSNLIRCTAGKWSNSTLICIEASSQTTTLPQSSTNTPGTTPASSSVPLSSRSTSTLSSSMTTHRPRRQDSTTSPSSLSLNSTSSSLLTESVATSVIVPVVLLLIVLAAGGAGCWLYKRKTRNRTKKKHKDEEERVPMRQTNGGT
ncbi:interleukin-15 receptor subunit alpha [Eucyclogobius newberryi]|uniref:interleukin-15 receptor subunit alpha n=1 Tax=Eucyclogobius newberryi TaxID=166745 RepID=UPI003B58B503